MKKIFLSCVFIICFSNLTKACSCLTPTLLESINRSNFIATAKILKAEQDTIDKEYHNIEIQIIDIYKGNPVTKLKIWSTQTSSCSFYTPVGTTWLIFANYNKEKMLSFHYCGGSIQIDNGFISKDFNGEDRYSENVKLKLNVLSFFRDKGITPNLKNNQKITWPRPCLEMAKGHDGDKRDFAVYECIMNTDMTVTKVKAVKTFSNKKLSRFFSSCIKNKLQNNNMYVKSIPEKTKQYLIYYFYPAEKADKSFVSVFDL